MKPVPLHEKPIWIPVKEMGANRFDPLYYDPVLTVAEHHFQSNGKLPWKRLAKVVSEPIFSFGAYELTNHIRFVAPGTGTVPFLTVTEIDNPFVDVSEARHIDRESHALLANSQCKSGTLLLSMAGTIGRIGVVPAGYGEYNSNQDTAKVVVDFAKSDAHFLAAYFCTQVGLGACHREAAGAVQKHLYLYNVEQLPVPDPDRALRVAIGHKVRAAERLRAAASRAKAAISGWLATCLPAWEKPSEQLAVTPIFNVEFSEARLDSWYNHPQFQRLEEALSSFKRLVPLSSISRTINDRWKGTTGEIEYIEIGEFDLAQGVAVGAVIDAAHAPSRAQIAARLGDVAVSLVRPNRKNVVFLQGSGKRPIVVTSGCDVLRFADADTAALYSIILRHNAVTHQVMRWNTGSSYPAIEQLPSNTVLVPPIPDGKRQELLQAARLAVTGVERAKELTRTAITDVENLIDSKLDEATCLEQGRQLAKEFGFDMP